MTMGREVDLSGLRVLVVEDSLLVAEVIAETLESHGCDVVGPVSRLQRALPLARDEPLHGALLDVNLAGEFCFPIAAALEARGVPFIFLTGYGDIEALPPEFQTKPLVGKPFVSSELVGLISQRFRRPA
jgi:DNA-binding response OmpR family regulator